MIAIIRFVAFVLMLTIAFVASPSFAAPSSYANASLPGMDFSNQNLAGANFSNATLTGSNFAGSNLTGAIFSNADLKGVSFKGATLIDARLTNASLDGADLTNANLTNADLTNANAPGAALGGAVFTGAKLTNSGINPAPAAASPILTPPSQTVDALPSAAAPPSVGSPAITTTTTEISVNYQNEQSAKGSFAMAALGIILLILVCLIVVAFCVVPLIVIVRCIINKELDKVEKTLWAVFTFLMPLVGFVYLIVVEKSRFWKTTGVLCLVAFGLFVVAIITAGVVGVAGLSPDEIKTMMHTATQKR